ncbi:hypothetical protein [Paenarthrobacter nitroguajacolicus]|uniref:hypothetical protein n=1 Tax=Paenarthrobacter nitroguajacolicus TaxID=211146 RepID=UPI0021196C26|nr:hypothetical protein [Paenarthrobacter nitroguajacolicus]
MTILAIVVMSKYKLTDALHAQIVGEIRARLSAGVAQDDAGKAQEEVAASHAVNGKAPGA